MRSLTALLVLLWASVGFAMSPKGIYKKAGPAVVLIFGADGGAAGSGGTGSIVTPDGKVITNAHVVLNEQEQPFKNLYVFLKPPKITGDNAKDLVNRYKVKVLAYSPAEQLDLAVLQIEDAPADLPTVSFTDPETVEIGDEVVAIGHPEQGGLWTLTTGTISTVIANFNRIKGKNVFQTDASINRGNSGGPLLDHEGNMVGINTMIARVGAGGVAITGINYSLKSSVAVNWLATNGVQLAYAGTGAAGADAVALASAGEAASRAGDKAGKQAPEAGTALARPAPAPQEPPAQVASAPAPAQPSDASSAPGKAAAGTAAEVVRGKKLDPARVKPKILTKQRPYNMDDLRAKAMKELEDMMDEMRGKLRGKKNSRGMGLW